MKFQHEVRKELIIQQEKNLLLTKAKIQKEKAKLQSLTQAELILWEIGQEFEEKDFVSFVTWDWSFHNGITICIKNSISSYAFEKLLDEIDEILDPYNYHLMLKESTFNSWNKKYNFYYCKNKKDINKTLYQVKTDYIAISFNSSQCKQVKTGRLIQETKEVCNMIN